MAETISHFTHFLKSSVWFLINLDKMCNATGTRFKKYLDFIIFPGTVISQMTNNCAVLRD